jgi:hypothetical protein
MGGLAMKTDAEILDWLQSRHTLHRQVEILYTVGGYQVTMTYDGEPMRGLRWHGETLRDACTKAMNS